MLLFPDVSTVMRGAPGVSPALPGAPRPVVGTPSYSEGRQECPPRVSYSPAIDASKFTLHILSDTPGGFQWLKFILQMNQCIPASLHHFDVIEEPNRLSLAASQSELIWKTLKWVCPGDCRSSRAANQEQMINVSQRPYTILMYLMSRIDWA